MKKVLIFGAGGFVGNYLAKEFVRSGYHVTGSDVNSRGALGDEVSFVQADLLKQEEVSELIRDCEPDLIVNLAAISSLGVSWKCPQDTVAVNVIGAVNILEAARKLSLIPRVLLIGSSEEYEATNEPMDENTPLRANNPYGISKLAQEQFVDIYRDRYGMKISYVRPFNHTGIGQRETFVLPDFCRQAAEIEKSGKPGKIMVGNLSVMRDFSDVRDVVRAYRMVLDAEQCSNVYNIGSGKAYCLKELLQYIVSLSTQKIEVVIDEKRFRPVDTPVVCCDSGRIEKELGWKPQFDIFQTLKEMYDFYLLQR